MPVLAENKKAFFDYEILETLEAGLVLTGQEVKAVRDGHISLKGSYAIVTNGECWLLNAHISPYKKAGPLVGYDPTHSRKLLLHKKELTSLVRTLQQKRLTLSPLRVYTKGRRIKVALGLARGKRLYEKRDTMRKREVAREIGRSLKSSWG